MNKLLEAYKNQDPEVIFEWNDRETYARGWVVINSLRNGAAGGGTRMRKGLTKDEVVSLAKVMEIKFRISGPDIGGAKSGIDFDPADPRRNEVLKRWYQAVFPLLKHYYGTGGDLNVDELRDVIPITEGLGLWHPQEGIVNGHLDVNKGDLVRILGQLRYGCGKIVEDPRYVPDGPFRYAVADMITGFGVAESVRHYYDLFRHTALEGKRAVIQGWGNVASAAASYLSVQGARIVGIIDREGGVLKEDGYTLDEVKTFFAEKKGNQLNASQMLSFEEINEKIWRQEADIFIPGAASKLVTRTQMEALIDRGLEVVACGANVPFVDDGIFFGETARYVDQTISLIPDFIANCGMARVFAYLMQETAVVTDEAIFDDVSHTIREALLKVATQEQGYTHIASRSLQQVLERLMAPKEQLSLL